MASTSGVSCKESYGREPSSAAGAAVALSLSSSSHAIAKTQQQPPKIRIVHIFAPEIIKTEVHNFRALVQRLTGKPQHTGRSNQLLLRRINKKVKKKQPPEATGRPPRHVQPKRDPQSGAEDPIPTTAGEIKIEPWMEEDAEADVMTMSSSSCSTSSMSSSGGFLDDLGDLEFGFLHGFGDLPWPTLLPVASSSSSHVDV